ncbi:MAG: hypothetical protein P8Y45_18635 [Exilibacterium sp.]|jgi:hypothetical protein
MAAGMGGLSLGASMAAQQMMDKTTAATTMMNATFQCQKMMTDTINSMANAAADSGSKALNASTQTGKSIQY